MAIGKAMNQHEGTNATSKHTFKHSPFPQRWKVCRNFKIWNSRDFKTYILSKI